jgi:hypothetical protein
LQVERTFQDVLVVVELVVPNSKPHNKLSHSACAQVRGLTPKISGANAFHSHITGREYSKAVATARPSEKMTPNRAANIRFIAAKPC